ncbi:MAG: hypothetical protein JRJ59_12835 [Deltaproteobacteria bacterium]|nr:hypothetical protein [Deltaproteobacteria bacterium]
MVRLLILIVAAYLVYRWLKGAKKKEAATSSGQPPVVDEMVQDPHCGAYFPKSQGVAAKVDGKRLLFCSEKCRDEYLARYKAHDVDRTGEEDK